MTIKASSLALPISWLSAFLRIWKGELINEARRPKSPRFRSYFTDFAARLPGDDAWRQEEQQFLRLDGDGGPFEEVADQRQATDDRNLLDVGVLGGDDDAANHDGAAVRNEYLGLRGLRVQRRDTLHARNTLIDLSIFHEHIHEDGAFSRNLRRDFKLQHGVDELHGNRIVDSRLNGQLDALLDDGLFVVLRHDARLREQLADALRFRRGDKEVESEVGRTVPEVEAARRNACAKVRGQRNARSVRSAGVAGRGNDDRRLG